MTAGRAPIDRQALRNAAFGYLARREHSRSELARKLERRFRDRAPEGMPLEQVVEQVVEELAAEGLQSDQRCIESLIRVRIARGHGPARIRADLRSIGLAGEAAECLLETEADGWAERVAELAERRFGGQPPQDRREWARRARFLVGRGFSEALVVAALGDPPSR